jgi:hypothetical protein
MSKNVVVYWTVPKWPDTEDYSELAYKSPNYPISKHFMQKFSYLEKNDEIKTYFRCPAFSKSLRNIFGIRAHKDYYIEKIGNTYSTSDKSKLDLSKNLYRRNSTESFLDLKWNILLFSEEDLEIDMLPAYLENNDFQNSINLLPGSYNISKWFRPIAPSFIQNKKRVEIKKNDILYYVKFKTNKKIIFKNFEYTDDINKLLFSTLHYKHTVTNSSLNKLYELFTTRFYHKRISKLIKENLTGY